MAPRPIRIGVAGLGRIGWDFHCKEIANSRAFELAAVQDVEVDRCREAEQLYGAATFTSFSEMLKSSDLEAVAIATPTHLHKDMALKALRAGCHVLLEKPMASNSQEAAAIVRSAARRGLLLTVYQPLRASAFFQHLRKVLASGLIGEVYHVRLGAFGFVRRNDWQSLRKYGGGMLNNYGAHGIDALLQLIGYDVKRVFCNLRAVASLGDAEDVVKVLLETRKGVLGELDVNQASAIAPHSTIVWGTRGTVSLSPKRDRLIVKHLPPEGLAPRKLDRSLASADRKYPAEKLSFKEEAVPVDRSLKVDVYANFAAAVRKRAPLFVKPKEPLAVMRIIDRCREDSGRLRRTPL